MKSDFDVDKMVDCKEKKKLLKYGITERRTFSISNTVTVAMQNTAFAIMFTHMVRKNVMNTNRCWLKCIKLILNKNYYCMQAGNLI